MATISRTYFSLFATVNVFFALICFCTHCKFVVCATILSVIQLSNAWKFQMNYANCIIKNPNAPDHARFIFLLSSFFSLRLCEMKCQRNISLVIFSHLNSHASCLTLMKLIFSLLLHDNEIYQNWHIER